MTSGKTFQRPSLAALLDHVLPGDILAVVRLARSLRELLDVVERLEAA